MVEPRSQRLPLSALLSFALVAFTIEADNEAEHRIPHRTTTRTGSISMQGAWLTSMAMWFNCLRWIPEQGIAVHEVEHLARTRTNWDGMRRWGYIYFEPNPTDHRPKPPLSALMVRATAHGRTAQATWRAVLPEIEGRWVERFGTTRIEELRAALIAVVGEMDPGLPDCLPILKYGLANEGAKPQRRAMADPTIADLPLPSLLARALLAFALEFERESAVSLAIAADVLRVIEAVGTAVRDLPALGGVSKEAIAMALGFLARRGFAVVTTGNKVKAVRLTPGGILARDACDKLAADLERRWTERYGEVRVEGLREVLKPISGDGRREGSPLFAGLEPHPDGWRAKGRKPVTLPHFPMVLHRGGYPDGS